MVVKLSEAKRIFLEAVDLEAEGARSKYLSEACQGDAGLRQRVESLLKAHAQSNALLDGSGLVATIDPPAADGPGAVIGPYKLLELIGEGGMGLVYMAQQTEPVKRKVALKVIKPGMDSRQVIARFAAERQALAMMDHPNIAKIFDAGTVGQSTKSQASSNKQIRSTNSQAPNEAGSPVSDIGPSDLEIVCDLELGHCDLTSGRPYFVMELVRGVPITEYCQSQRLGTPERLKLFLDVCSAVQHAHQKGIIHRDLKPSNVLITLHDGVPVVKVIDFGVAKALNQELTERTLFTQFSQMIGTPLYMSPEQAELSGLDIDTRSDVYSLGVLLYELLTGTTPFDKDRLKSVGFDELRRIIREEEPETVSARIAKTRRVGSAHENPLPRGEGGRRPGEGVPQSTSPATSRQPRAPRLSELDWIAMKALEKDRTHRYESASALAADIQRYLSDEPVHAYPPTAMYRFQKFARKHKPAFVTAAAIALCLLLGTTVSAWQAVRATQAEALANTNASQAKEKAQEATDQRDEAQKQRDEVKALADKLATKEQQLQRTLYAAHMNLAHNAWSTAGVGRVLDMLEQHRPKPGETDLRGFEWHYLNRLCHADLLTFKGHTTEVHCVAYSPDGQRVASVGAGELKVWNPQSGQEILTIQDGNRIVAFSPDGKRLASFSKNKTVTIWDSASGKELLSVPGTPHQHSAIVFSPDGKRLAVSRRVDMESIDITVWNAESGQELLSLPGFGQLTFSPDGKRLTSGSPLGVRDLQTGKQLLFIKDSGEDSYAISPDGKRAAGAIRTFGSGEAAIGKVWDIETGKELLTIKAATREGLQNLVFSPDGNRLAGASRDQVIIIWDAETGQQLATLKGHTRLIDCVAFSPDGKRLASASADTTVKIWRTEALTSPEAQTFKGGNDRVWGVAFSPDGKRLASGTHDGRSKIKIWDAQTGQDLLSFEGHKRGIWGVAFSPDGQRLATGGEDNTVKVWDAQTGKALLALKNVGPIEVVTPATPAGHFQTNRILGVIFSPDGKRLASASHDPNLAIWDAETGQQILKLTGLSNRREGDVWPTRRIAFSPDGSRVASGFEDQAKVWDTKTGKELLTLKGSVAKQMGVAFSPDGKRLALGRFGEIELVDVQTGAVILTLRGHSDIVPTVLFSPDGRRLASASHDGTIKLWDPETGHDTLTLTGHTDRLSNLAFSPDGHRLASNGADGTVKIWDATPLPEN